MGLKKYQKKRDFSKTKEPKGKVAKKKKTKKPDQLIFVIHRHAASRLHFDFRFEYEGVLKSFPIPKGPSMDPGEKRLAIQVEDHPLEYASFEGEIPEGNYGAGTMEIWDSGTIHYPGIENEGKKKNEEKFAWGFGKGHLKFILKGKKLKGEFSLVQLKKEQNNWLFIKGNDKYARKEFDDLEKEVHTKKKKPFKSLTKTQLNALTKKMHLKKAKFKQFNPMLAKLVDGPFDDKDTLYELKYDGFRALAYCKGEDVELRSRNYKMLNEVFPSVTETLERIPYDVILDGEVAALDDSGRPRFELIKKNLGEAKNIRYFVFDILYLNGFDISHLPLIERKKILKKILPRSASVVYVDHILKKGTAFFEEVKKSGLEGIIAKDTHSLYEPGKRSGAWKKIKTSREAKVYIVGYTKGKGRNAGIGALAVASKRGKKFTYLGNVGSGFSARQSKELVSLLSKIHAKKHPFSKEPESLQEVEWVKPEYKCEVEYAEITPSGKLRHARFMGLEGVNVAEQKETFNSKADVHKKFHISHPDKIYFPKSKISKRELIEYYIDIADYILPYLKDRPLSLNRFPDGIEGESFFQKDMPDHTPKWVKTHKVFSKSNEKNVRYMMCNDKASLIYAVNSGSIELNPWNSRVGKLSFPDYVVIDLDPHGVPFGDVIKVAKGLNKILERIDVKSFPKTSGKKGMHVFIPLGAKYTYKQALEFVKVIGLMLHNDFPKITSLERSPAKRKNKLYIDLYQNAKGQTLAAPYSVRPIEGAQVSVPLRWKEVNASLDPKKYTIKNMKRRLSAVGDVWSGTLNRGINMQRALKNIEKEMKQH